MYCSGMHIGTYLANHLREQEIHMKTVAKLVKDWETKNTRNVAKSGGVSMMALSLAACGGGGSPAPVIEETPVVVTPPVVVPITEALTIWNDTVVGTTEAILSLVLV
jgi:hypothetical protein